jgi:hypothetical protein
MFLVGWRGILGNLRISFPFDKRMKSGEEITPTSSFYIISQSFNRQMGGVTN